MTNLINNRARTGRSTGRQTSGTLDGTSRDALPGNRFGSRRSLLVLALLAVVPSSGWAQIDPNLHAQVMARLRLTRCQLEEVALPAPDAQTQVRERRGNLKIPVNLGGETLTLDLQPYSVRSEKFKLLVQQAGGAILEEPAPLPSTWRGSVMGKPGSAVTASLTDGALRASIRLDDGSSWTVQPARPLVAAARIPTHAVYKNSDLLPAKQ